MDGLPSGVPKAQLPAPILTELSGWGANLRSACAFVRPETPAELISDLDRRGTIARGLGRSYGDPALNAGGPVLGMERVDRSLAFDDDTGVLTCEAGVSLEQIIEDFAPRGWFPAITPGTKFVTVGGCIANDIHGKAHHSQGCFSSCVEPMTVLLADGSVVSASPRAHADLFWGPRAARSRPRAASSAVVSCRWAKRTDSRRAFPSRPEASVGEHVLPNTHRITFANDVEESKSGKDLGCGPIWVHALRPDGHGHGSFYHPVASVASVASVADTLVLLCDPSASEFEPHAINVHPIPRPTSLRVDVSTARAYHCGLTAPSFPERPTTEKGTAWVLAARHRRRAGIRPVGDPAAPD